MLLLLLLLKRWWVLVVSEGAANLVHETQDLVELLMSGRRFEVSSSLLPWRRRVASRVIVIY